MGNGVFFFKKKNVLEENKACVSIKPIYKTGWVMVDQGLV